MFINVTIESRLYSEQVKKHGSTERAVLETIRICKNDNILRHYLEQHETEATSIMMALFSEEYIQKAYGKEKFDEGLTEGKTGQAKKTALNLHRAGMSEGMIAQMIGFAPDTVRAWLEQAEGSAS